MKKFLLLALVVFSFTSLSHAIGDIESEKCTVKLKEKLTEDNREAVVGEAIEEVYKANEENREAGKAVCSCFVIQASNGAKTYATKNADGETEQVKYCVALQEPIAGINSISGKDGVSLFSNYIKQIYLYGASIIGIICVLIIVVSGIQISLGGANSEFVNQGKERIMQAMLSLLLLFGSALILQTINPGFFTTNPPAISDENKQTLAEAIDASEDQQDAAGVVDTTTPCRTETTDRDTACSADATSDECKDKQEALDSCLEDKGHYVNSGGSSQGFAGNFTPGPNCPIVTVGSQKIHKNFKSKYDQLIKYASDNNITLQINSAYRNYVTTSESRHMIGYAIDANIEGCLWKAGNKCLQQDFDDYPEKVRNFITYAKSIGLRWGGDFNSYFDPVHFDLNTSNWQSIRDEIGTGCYPAPATS